MRLISINNSRPGMRLGKSIYNENGLILLNENVELTQNLLDRLEKNGVEYIYVQDSRTDDIVVQDPVSDETQIKVLSEVRSNFRKLMDENMGSKKVQQNKFLGRDFRNLVSLIIDDLNNHHNAMTMLSTISITDFYLFQHSMNVCIYTTMIGMNSGYTKDELVTLSLGSLLHDIGKTKIPMDILQKPGKLTDSEMALMEKHTEFGFKLLKDEPNIPLIAAHCAFQHHERLDGSGYPRKIEDKEIHDYAKWIAIIDSYDAMTTHRVYRKAMLPHQAMEVLFTGAGTLYDQQKLELFRDKFALYPLGISVQLSTGEAGVVVDINSNSPQRPIIRILQDADGQNLTQPYEIDLSKKLNVMISSVNDVMLE